MLSQQSMLLIDDILANSVSFFLEGRGGEGAGSLARVRPVSLSLLPG